MRAFFLAAARSRASRGAIVASRISRSRSSIEAAIANSGTGTISDAERQAIKDAVVARLVPAFTSLRYADPGYCQLRLSAPEQIRAGADDEAEMGVFHDLFQPQRESNIRARLREYLRFGLEAGIFY